MALLLSDSDVTLSSPRSPDFRGSDISVGGQSHFSRVPTEIKALIATFAARQDEAYRQREQKPQPPSPPYPKKVVRGGARSWDGRTVNALFCASPEWNALAAPHVFKSITSKDCSDSLFTFNIAIRYAEFVESAILDGTERQESLLYSMRGFSNLQHLSLTGFALEETFDAGSSSVYRRRHSSMPSPTIQQLLHRKALFDVLKRISELSLVNTNPYQLAWILPRLESFIKRLNISLLSDQIDDERDPDEPKAARQALSQLTTIEHLSIEGLTFKTYALLDAADDTIWHLGASLKSLKVASLHHWHLSEGNWNAIESFTRLEKLDLDIESSEMAEALALRAEGGSKTSFPVLSHVRLHAPEDSLRHLLSLFSLSPVNTLALTIAAEDGDPELVHGGAVDALHTLLQHALNQFLGTLKQVDLLVGPSLLPFNSVSSSDLAALSSLASEHDVALTAGPLYDAFTSRRDNFQPPPLPDACAAIDETLKFGLAQSALLLQRGDAAGARAMLDVVMPLHKMMLKEKD